MNHAITIGRGVVLLALLLLLLQAARHAGEKPRLLVEPTPAKVWTHVWSAPPQFCPAPLPVCQGRRCPKSRSLA